MTRINTNVSSLVAQKTLARSNSDLQLALSRLSTGLRITRGKDDPAGLIASEVLRSDIVSVQRAITNSERANQLIATADSALGQVSTLLNDVRGLISEAANSGALSEDQIQANQLQIDSALEAIDRIAQTTSFQGRRLLDGSLGFITSATEQFSTGLVGNVASVKAAGTFGDIDGTAATGTIENAGADGSFDLTATANGAIFNDLAVDFVVDDVLVAAAGDEIVAYDSDNNVLTITINSASEAADIEAAINDQVGFAFTASNSAGNGNFDDNDSLAAGAALAGGNGGTQLTLTANLGGPQYNGTVIIEVDDGTVTSVGEEIVAYDDGNQELTVTVNSASTAADIAAAINSATGANAVYSAVVNGDGTGVFDLDGGGDDTFTDVLAGGQAGNQFRLTALNAGPDYDGVDVEYSFSAALGAETVAYNSSTRVLSLNVHTDTTVEEVVDLINDDPTVGALFAAQLLDDGSSDDIGQSASTTDATSGGISTANLKGLKIDQANFGTQSSINVLVAIDQQATQAKLTYEDGNLDEDLILEIGGKNGFEVFNFGSGTTIDQIKTAINLVSDATGVEAETSFGVLTFKSSEYGSSAFVSAKAISGEFATKAGTQSATRTEGSDVQVRINGVTATGSGLNVALNTSTLDLSFTVDSSLADNSQFSFNITGGGANFQLGPDVVSNQQARLGIQGVSTATLGGISGTLFQLRSGGAKDLQTDVKAAAKVVDEVITIVTGLRGRLGAFQKTTLETNIFSLSDTLENLTDAESSIRDADFAAESARLTRAQILVQSGTVVLQVANQSPQNVLALLQ